MPINHEYKFLYIHIPRTAGHSINYAFYNAGLELEGFGNKHILPSALKPKIPEWDKYWKFAFVRNPFDRLVSRYHHRIQNMGSKAFAKYGSFTKWFNKNHEKLKPLKAEMEEMDFIGKYENLYEDFSKVCKHLKIKNCMSKDKANSSKHVNYKEYYNEEMIEIMNKIYQGEFGYEY